jgi:hypothetical protein
MEKPPRNSTVVQQRWIGNWQLRTTHWKAFKVELLWLLAMPAEGDFLQQSLPQLPEALEPSAPQWARI